MAATIASPILAAGRASCRQIGVRRTSSPSIQMQMVRKQQSICRVVAALEDVQAINHSGGDAMGSSVGVVEAMTGKEVVDVGVVTLDDGIGGGGARDETGGNGDGGGGGGNDRGDDGHGDGNKEDGPKQSKALSMSQKLTLVYAGLVGFGGLMGFLKSGSTKSLFSGAMSASILYYVYTQLPVNPVAASSIGVGISALLLAVMGSRFKASGKWFPAGVVSVVSFIMTGGYVHGIMRSSHHG